MQTFQRLMGGMNCWGRLHLNQIRSAVRSGLRFRLGDNLASVPRHFYNCPVTYVVLLGGWTVQSSQMSQWGQNRFEVAFRFFFKTKLEISKCFVSSSSLLNIEIPWIYLFNFRIWIFKLVYNRNHILVSEIKTNVQVGYRYWC